MLFQRKSKKLKKIEKKFKKGIDKVKSVWYNSKALCEKAGWKKETEPCQIRFDALKDPWKLNNELIRKRELMYKRRNSEILLGF